MNDQLITDYLSDEEASMIARNWIRNNDVDMQNKPITFDTIVRLSNTCLLLYTLLPKRWKLTVWKDGRVELHK